GEIENLPAADNSVDVIISNCVINLSPEKERVFRETFRVLKPGGRLMVSDIVLLRELPDFIKNNYDAYVNCVAGAVLKNQYIESIKEAGFHEVNIVKIFLPCVFSSFINHRRCHIYSNDFSTFTNLIRCKKA
ncbi:unnamed protein product, partial [marine sediment metagenome]